MKNSDLDKSVLRKYVCAIHTAYIKATHIRSVHRNKLSLWLNCRTVRRSCRNETCGACGGARGFNARFVFPTHPPTHPSVSHCDRCRIAKFIPNLIAVRQWTQCGIVYYPIMPVLVHLLRTQKFMTPKKFSRREC